MLAVAGKMGAVVSGDVFEAGGVSINKIKNDFYDLYNYNLNCLCFGVD
jgi:hypothetical protein